MSVVEAFGAFAVEAMPYCQPPAFAATANGPVAAIDYYYCCCHSNVDAVRVPPTPVLVAARRPVAGRSCPDLTATDCCHTKTMTTVTTKLKYDKIFIDRR